METWHNRLEQALKARGKTYADLVRITKLAKPSVYAWQSGATKRTEMMDGNNAALVCDALRISPLWLFYAKGEAPDFSGQSRQFVQSPRADYLVEREWPFLPAHEQDYYSLSDEARGWVKCRLAQAIDEAKAKFDGNSNQAAA